ncbi:MAG: TatD family hydrolase [Rikenellaceae bacterium]
MFIDIHTHKVSKIKSNITITSFRYGYEEIPNIPYASAAIHPWDVDNSILLSEYESKIGSFFMMSEIGLDKLYPSYQQQKELFIAQLNLARKYNKIVVIHSVKSHNEILSILRSFSDLTMIIHSFTGSLEIAQNYLDLGCYLSFSPLSLSSEKGKTIFQHIPLNRLFFESDATNITIEEQYLTGVEMLSTNVDNLKNIVLENFKNLCSNRVQSCY